MDGILDGLIDRKVKKILNLFIENKDELFHLQKISKNSGVPISSSFRLIKKLVILGFVDVVKINKFKVYKLAKNKKIKTLIGIWER